MSEEVDLQRVLVMRCPKAHHWKTGLSPCLYSPNPADFLFCHSSHGQWEAKISMSLNGNKGEEIEEGHLAYLYFKGDSNFWPSGFLCGVSA